MEQFPKPLTLWLLLLRSRNPLELNARKFAAAAFRMPGEVWRIRPAPLPPGRPLLPAQSQALHARDRVLAANGAAQALPQQDKPLHGLLAPPLARLGRPRSQPLFPPLSAPLALRLLLPPLQGYQPPRAKTQLLALLKARARAPLVKPWPELNLQMALRAHLPTVLLAQPLLRLREPLTSARLLALL